MLAYAITVPVLNKILNDYQERKAKEQGVRKKKISNYVFKGKKTLGMIN